MARVWESRLIFKDIQYGALKVDLADMEFSLPSVNESFTNEEKNVKVRNLILQCPIIATLGIVLLIQKLFYLKDTFPLL